MWNAVWWARFRAVVVFEVRAQAREPLTTLYALVFGLLSLGYASSDAVELVSNRGAVPRTASWALTLAFGGLTAFGQVITTMIATTAMLRDEAQRTRGLVATTGLTPRTWFVARVSAALVVMLAVYAAMPLGIIVGTAAAGGDLTAAAGGSARAYLVITVPTMVTVTVLLSCAALLTQRVLGVLAAALSLVAVWQGALGLVARPAFATLGALLDPFGNAPVLAVTQAWPVGDRATLAVPLAGVVIANRVLWLGLALAITTLVLLTRADLAFTPTSPAATRRGDAPVSRAIARADSALSTLRRFTASWMRYDGGWRVVSILAVLNAVFNAATRTLPIAASPLSGVVSALSLVSEHSRLFLILLATVYAGELVWRERDVRVQQLVDALPVSRGTMALGRIQGLLLAQWQVVMPLALVALLVTVARTGTDAIRHWPAWFAWSVFVLWLPFAQLTLLSLAVHVWLDRKVMAHLLLITGWVVAVVLNRQGVSTWWIRFAEPAPLLQHDAVAWSLLTQRGAYWCAVSAALGWYCWWRWPSASEGQRA